MDPVKRKDLDLAAVLRHGKTAYRAAERLRLMTHQHHFAYYGYGEGTKPSPWPGIADDELKAAAETIAAAKRELYYAVLSLSSAQENLKNARRLRPKRELAEMLLNEGMPVEIVAERTGYSAEVLAKIYPHLIPGAQEQPTALNGTLI